MFALCCAWLATLPTHAQEAQPQVQAPATEQAPAATPATPPKREPLFRMEVKFPEPKPLALEGTELISSLGGMWNTANPIQLLLQERIVMQPQEFGKWSVAGAANFAFKPFNGDFFNPLSLSVLGQYNILGDAHSRYLAPRLAVGAGVGAIPGMIRKNDARFFDAVALTLMASYTGKVFPGELGGFHAELMLHPVTALGRFGGGSAKLTWMLIGREHPQLSPAFAGLSLAAFALRDWERQKFLISLAPTFDIGARW